MIDSLDWSLQLNNFDLCRHHQLIRQYVHVHTAHTHMCFFKPCHVKAKRSSYVSSSHSNCNNLTIFNGAYRLLPLLLHCTKQLHTNCTNAAPSIKHIAAYCSFFVRFFVWSCFWFVMCWCLFSKCKKMTWWFVVSFGLQHNLIIQEKEKI